MKMTNEEYGEFIKGRQPKSPLGRNMLLAFVSGGIICCIGQLMTETFLNFGLEKTDAATAAGISMVFLGALLTGLGIYDDLARHCGGGTLVPITGFANSVVSPALEFKAEGMVTGMAAKMFVISGPVIVYGTAAGVVYGLIYWIYLMI